MSSTQNTHATRGFIFIALSAILFGSLGVATQFVFQSAPNTNAYSVTLWRALIALPVLILIAIPVVGKKFFNITRRDWGIMIFAGLMMAVYQVSFVLALRLVNVTIATLITLCMVPVFAALLSAPLLHERVHRNIYIAMVIAIAGVVLLVGFQPVNDFGANAWLGIVLALVTALGSALFQICGRMVSNRYHPLQTLTIFFFVAALALLPNTLLNGFVVNYPPMGWVFLLHLGIGISVIGYGFLILGLRTTPATIATIIALLEPLTGALLAWVFLGERLGALGIVGAALLLGAMVLVMRSNRETAEPGEI